MSANESERFAFEVVRRVTGHTVSLIDDGTAPRMVDGGWTDSSGRRHVIEVTNLIASNTAELLSQLRSLNYRVPAKPLEARWVARVAAPVKPARLDPNELGALLFDCENRGIVRASHIPDWELDGFGQVGRWVRSGALEAIRYVGERNPGWVSLWPQGDGGGLPGMSAVTEWLTGVLPTHRHLSGKIAKLRDWEADIRHLYVGMFQSGASFAVLSALTDPHAEPDEPARLPAGLDGLWLQPAWGDAMLIWLPGEGWLRHDLTSGD